VENGVIVSINQVAIGVQFRPGEVPQLFEALLVPEVGLILEVQLQLERGLIRALALGPVDTLCRGMPVARLGVPVSVPVDRSVLGRILNALGEPIDDLGKVVSTEWCAVRQPPRVAEKYGGTVEILETGIKGIDLLCPIIKGGVAGLFGSPLAGGETPLINTLLLHLLRDESTYCVYAGVGACTREIGDLHHALRDENAFDRVVMVVASAGEPCAMRIHACLCALTIAERLRDEGADVLFCLDDVWQYAQARRELAADLGQPASEEQLTPTLFEELASLADRSCSSTQGFITSIHAIRTAHSGAMDRLVTMLSGFYDTTIVFRDHEIVDRLLPQIDWPNCKSRHMNETVLDRYHYTVARAVMELFHWMARLQPQIDLIGLESFCEGEKLIFLRSRRLQRFLTQPLFEVFVGPGKYIPLRDTITDCMGIVNGDWDHLPEQAFYLVGSMADVLDKAERMLVHL
jgi:F-type H+-transporting ATPase subunit beta